MEMIRNITIGKITDVRTIYSPKGKQEKVTNRRCYGMSFCSDGEIAYTHNGHTYISDNKHIVIHPKGQSYSFKVNKTGVFSVINFELTEPLSDSFLLFPVQNTDNFIKEFEIMKKLILFPESHAKVMSIFYNMIHNLIPENYLCNTIAPAVKYIRDNYKNPELSNEILSRECNISEVYLRKLFIKHLQTTPKQYICELRLQNAKQLLSEGILKISAVSEECGFLSSYNFCRFFKEKTGLTPTEFMKKNKSYQI